MTFNYNSDKYLPPLCSKFFRSQIHVPDLDRYLHRTGNIRTKSEAYSRDYVFSYSKKGQRNSAQATRGEAQKGVAKGGGSLDYASKKYFKCYILCGRLVKVNFKKENARLHFGF